MPWVLSGFAPKKQYPGEIRRKAAAEERREARAAKQIKLESVARVKVPEDCPIFATCDDVRRMIEIYLAGTEMTRSAFAKAIGSSDSTVSKFQQLTGERAGIKSVVYYKAWRFFEQLRIYDMREKSELRLSDEKKWGPDGFYKPEIHRNDNPTSTSAAKKRKTVDPADLVQFTVYGEPAAEDTVTVA